MSSSPDGADGLRQLSLFLTLAFVLPGIVYAVFVYLFFRSSVRPILPDFTAPALKLAVIIVGVMFLGIVLTAIAFVIEFWVLRKIHWLSKVVPKVGFQEIVERDLRGQRTGLLLRQAGQGIMHYNISAGVLVLLLLYLGAGLLGFTGFNPWYAGVALVVISTNIPVSYQFMTWTAEALDRTTPSED